jgi:hypothetical protein
MDAELGRAGNSRGLGRDAYRLGPVGRARALVRLSTETQIRHATEISISIRLWHIHESICSWITRLSSLPVRRRVCPVAGLKSH